MPFLPDVDMEYDPDGSTEQVAVVMKGKTYKNAGLNKSKFPNVEGPLYDKLCEFPRHKYRDEVRKMAMNIAILHNEPNFKPTIEWLDNFMRRFCISRKKSGASYKKNFLKIKGSKNKNQSSSANTTVETNLLLNEEGELLPNGSQRSTEEPVILPFTDPLDLGENFTTFLTPNGVNETPSLVSNKESDYLSQKSDETIIFNSQIIKDIRKIENENSNVVIKDNNADNGEHLSDSDDSIKEIPREKSPEKEVISLIDSEDDTVSKASIKNEVFDKETKEKAQNNGENSKSRENSDKEEENSSKKSNDGVNEDDKVKEKEIVEEEKMEEEEIEEEEKVEEKEIEEKEKSEEEEIEEADTDSESENDSDSSSSSEKSEDPEDLVVKQKKSWEEMNYVEYTKDEENYYSSNASNLQKKLDEKIPLCTACFEQVNHTVKDYVFTHPVLGVLVCKKCFRFYGKGNFKKDADGYDEYCRWCANGGDLLLCDNCTNGFCKKCIKRNLGRTAEKQAIKSKSWECYVCNLSPLTDVRAFHRTIVDQLRSVSILKKSLSRKERKELSVKQKFTTLKMKRKTQGYATKESSSSNSNKGNFKDDNDIDTSKKNIPSEFTKIANDIKELCNICIEQVDCIENRSCNDKSENAKVKCQRRLLRLSNYMEQNFNTIKNSIAEASGLKIEEIVLSSSQKNNDTPESNVNNSNKKESKKSSSHQNPCTIANSSKETASKQTNKRQRMSDDSDSEGKSPPAKRVIMETDDEMETDQQKLNETEILVNKDDNVNSNNANDDKETNEGDKDGYASTDSSNERDIGETPFDDRASSKNPDGDTERDEVEDESTKAETVSENTKSSTQRSISQSGSEISQSLLQDVQATQNCSDNGPIQSTTTSREFKEKTNSSDDNDTSKKGIIYRKSKLLKNSKAQLSDEEKSNEKSNSVETSTENGCSNETSSDKLKKVNEKSDSAEEDEEKKEMSKCEAEVKSNDSGNDKKTLRLQNNLKSLLETDSDESNDSHSDLGVNVKNKKSSDKTTVKVKSLGKKKSYKPKPKSVQDEIRNKQLKSCSVNVETLPKSIKCKLDEEEYICISDFPEYFAKDVDLGLGSESDKELDTILKTKTKIMRKRKHSGSENDADSEDSSQEEDESGSRTKEKKRAVGKKSEKEKVGLLDISLENEDDGDNEESDNENKDEGDMSKLKLMSMNMKSLLVSSDDGGEENEEESTIVDASQEITQEELEKKKRELYEKNKQKLKEKQQNSDSENEEIVKNVKRKGFLSFKFSSSDDDDDDESEKETPRKARMFIESDSDFETASKKKKKKKKTDSDDEIFVTSSSDDDDDGDSSSDERNKKEKKSKSRKRIKRPSSSTEEEGDEANENDLETPKKRHRRIIRDEDLLQSTKDATQEEKERRDRVKERQLKYNKMFEIDVEKDQADKKKLILDFNEKSKEELVSVHEKLVSHLKPHQHKGIKFMWDTTVESIEMLKKDNGGGCILAHCMGLGKTLQVIAFIHTLLRNKYINQTISRVMVCCPVNTVYNWKAEFRQWLKGKLDTFDVVELVSAKDLWGRAYRLEDWYNEGGVCVIGYDMFRNLSNEKNKKLKGSLKDKFQKYLVNPGPDLMVCDEGHILKNEKTALSIAINKIATKRRIVLTGTPLQNNLKEYHCMIQFVKPNLLGSKKEFMNRFVHPIEAGQCVEAAKKEVSRMKRRAHILHNLLEGCVQRFDYTVLKPFLPPKFEYVISVQMCKEQIKLYDYYLQNLAQGGPKRHGSGLFVDFNNLSRIWSHPVVLFYALQRWMDTDLGDEEEDGDLDGFIDDSDSSLDFSEEERKRKKKSKKKPDKVEDEEEEETKVVEGENNKDEGTEDKNIETAEHPVGLTADGKVRRDWFKKVVEEMCGDELDDDSFFNRIEISGKLYLLLDILREASSIGDKVLLFSQSIMVLDMIQEFLRMINDKEISFPPEGVEDTAGNIPQPFKHWIVEKDYFRLDGSTPADVRKDMCNSFNNFTNERCRLFLISTKAGGVGINLVAANRVIIFDSSWNPSHDTQSIFRVYRFGQKKPCYIYRFVAQGTMEEKIYSRQVTKISTSLRVVDEHQIKRHFNMAQLTELYEFTPSDPEQRETPQVPEDTLLAELLIRNKNWIVKYHEQDSLLENQTSEELTEEERNAAWEDYENEKKGIVPKTYNIGSANVPSFQGIAPFDIEEVYKSVQKVNPKATTAQLYDSVYLATQQIQRVHISQFQNLQAIMYNMATNPMLVPELLRTSMFKDRGQLIKHYDSQLRVLENNIQSESNVLKQIATATNRAIPPSAKMAAGLTRGNPSSGGISSTTQYVSRNIPASNIPNTSYNTVSKPSTSNAASSSAVPAAGTSEAAANSTEKEEITLE